MIQRLKQWRLSQNIVFSIRERERESLNKRELVYSSQFKVPLDHNGYDFTMCHFDVEA